MTIVLGVALGQWQNAARGAGRADPATSLVRSLLAPGSNLFAGWASSTEDFIVGFFHSGDLVRENRRLRQFESVASLYNERTRLVVQERDDLRRMLGMRRLFADRPAVFGQVVGYFPHENRATINLGSAAGIEAGMPVLVAEGLLGVVQTVDRSSAQVLLVSSPALRVGAVAVGPAPVAGLLRGEGPDRLVFDFVETVDLTPGIEVLTSGYSERIPRGIPIGFVVQGVYEPEFGTRRAFVYPRAQIANAYEVLVLR